MAGTCSTDASGLQLLNNTPRNIANRPRAERDDEISGSHEPHDCIGHVRNRINQMHRALPRPPDGRSYCLGCCAWNRLLTGPVDLCQNNFVCSRARLSKLL